MSLNITLNNEKIKINLSENRRKRLSRYLFSYIVDKESWQMAENIVENFLNAKNVNFHDPRFPYIDLIVKKSNKFCTKNDLLNVKSSRQKTLRLAILASLRGNNPKFKFLISQINYILRATNTRKAGQQMLGAKILKKALNSSNFEKTLKFEILKEYNKEHDTKFTNFDNIPILNQNVAICFIYNPYFLETHNTYCELDFAKTHAKKFNNLFNRTLKKCLNKDFNIADLIFYVFQEKNDQFSYQFKMSTYFDNTDVKKIRKIFGLNGSMSNLKNDIINIIRDTGSLKELRQFKKRLKS